MSLLKSVHGSTWMKSVRGSIWRTRALPTMPFSSSRRATSESSAMGESWPSSVREMCSVRWRFSATGGETPMSSPNPIPGSCSCSGAGSGRCRRPCQTCAADSRTWFGSGRSRSQRRKPLSTSTAFTPDTRLLQEPVRGEELPGHRGHLPPADHDLADQFGHVLRGEPCAHAIEQRPNLIVQLLRADHRCDVLRVLKMFVVHQRNEPVLPD